MRARIIPALVLALVALLTAVPEARAQVVGGFDFDRAEVSVTGLRVPWGLAFLDDGSALVSERNTGRILRVRPGQAPAQVATVSGVSASGESGLLGIAARDGWVYAYFTSTAGDNRLIRFQLSAPQTQTVILSGVPSAAIHDGGRIAFGPDGMLYVATGDAGATGNAQNLDSLAGKILRITPTGGIPSGNPFPGSPVWSYGHRNVQGLAWDEQGRMYATEFGQNTWDEINRIVAGGNYGWPTCEGTCGSGFQNPIVTWTTAQASPSGLAYANGTLFAAALRGQRLWAVPLNDDGTAGTPQAEFTSEYGRLRTVAAGPDGWLWVATSNHDGRGNPVAQDDRIIRVPPAGNGGDPTGGCTAEATTQTQWPTGYVVQPVTVTNTGTEPTTGWRVTVSMPEGHRVTGVWNAVWSGDAFENAPYNGALAPGVSTTFGFQVSRPANAAGTPSGFACAVR